MLISNKKYDSNAIVAFKLSNGDEIVAKIIDDNDNSFTIDNPHTVMPSNQGLGLIQSLFSADKEIQVTLSKNHVMMSAPVVDAMRDHYTKTTTGLETIRKPGLIV